jgi:ubiquinone/menaquinone biosynthesis C-methylase UbiE
MVYYEEENQGWKKNESTRSRWIKNKLEQIPAGLTILDAGAGEQQYKKYCHHLNYVSQDFGQYNGKGDDRGLQTGVWQSDTDIISDIIAIPKADESFDAILCTEVFEHIPEPIPVIEEFQRLLRPGGYLILTAPFCSLTHFAPYHFYSGYNRYFYEKHLSEHEFTIKEIKENGNFFEYLAQELRRVPYVSTRYCNKKLTNKELRQMNKFLLVLEKFANIDKGSKELLCHGYHILAIKK